MAVMVRRWVLAGVVAAGLFGAGAVTFGEETAVSQPICLGIFGSPQDIWDRGETLADWHINAVFVGHGSLSTEFIERCHREGAKVYGEFGVLVGKEIAEQHPELWPIGVDGKPLEPDEWYLGLCPAHEWFAQEKLTELREMARAYAVDGVWLDFIRWPCHWEVLQPRIEESCFCDYAVARFAAETGCEVSGDNVPARAQCILTKYPEEWARWKADQIIAFCRAARDILRHERPEALLGIFSVPWSPENYGDAMGRIIAQDFRRLAAYVDVFTPMAYHAMCGWPPEWVGEHAAYLVERTGRPVWPIVQATDAPPVSAEEFARAIEAAFAGGANGVMPFTFADVLKSEEKAASLKRLYATRAER
jgi:hypothetical protein